MAAVSEWIVREYFEQLGFFVRQPTKYQVSARSKQAEEEVNLIVVNPRVKETTLPEGILWAADELAQVSCALVGVRGWHTDRFSPAVIEQSPEIYRFAEADVSAAMAEEVGTDQVAKILCLPALPTSPELEEASLALLKRQGVDGVMTFRGMLLELAEHIDVNKNYEKSDLLQVIRILKNYGLIKDAQMELFGPKNKRS